MRQPARSRHWQVCTRQRPRCARARATVQAGRFALSHVPFRWVVATQLVCMGRWARHRRGPTAHAAGGANTGGCTLKLAQEWRQMRSAVGETARTDAGGAFESCDNDTTLSIATLRAARGTGIYKAIPPPVSFSTGGTAAIHTHTCQRTLKMHAGSTNDTCTPHTLHVTLKKSLNGHI